MTDALKSIGFLLAPIRRFEENQSNPFSNGFR